MSTRPRPVNGLRSRLRDGASRRAADERGVVIVWLVITLVVLLGVTAFALDVGFWRVTQTREQRAADAAALAGAINFPGDPVEANAAAVDMAGSNGYPVAAVTPVANGDTCPLGGETTSVCVGAGAQPFQYKVTVTQQVKNMLRRNLRHRLGDRARDRHCRIPQAALMGSPSNQFGNDPDATSWPISRPSQLSELLGQHRGRRLGQGERRRLRRRLLRHPDRRLQRNREWRQPRLQANGYFYAVDFSGARDRQPAGLRSRVRRCRRLVHDNHDNLLAAAALPTCPAIPRGRIRRTGEALPARHEPERSTDPGYQYCTGDQLFADRVRSAPDHDVHGAQGHCSR